MVQVLSANFPSYHNRRSLPGAAAARRFAMEGWQLTQQTGDRWLVTHLFTLGYAAQCEGDYPEARRYYQEAFSANKEVNDTNGMIISLGFLGNLELTSSVSNALAYFREYAELAYDAYQFVVPHALCNLGAAAVMHCQSLPLAGRAASRAYT